MNQQVLEENQAFIKRIAELKTKTPLYPRVYFELDETNPWKKQWCSTIIEFEREGKKYRRHVLEVAFINNLVSINSIYNKLMNLAEQNIQFAIPTDFDQLITD